MDRTVVQRFFEMDLRSDGIVWLRRRGVPYDSILDLHHAYDEFLATVDDWLLERRIKAGLLGTRKRTPMAWLYDLRGGPPQRNDPVLEEAIRARRADLLARSPLLAILVKTMAGRMQLSRMARETRTDLFISDDFDDTVSWLLEQMPSAFAKK
jgi:hypothetical protein